MFRRCLYRLWKKKVVPWTTTVTNWMYLELEYSLILYQRYSFLCLLVVHLHTQNCRHCCCFRCYLKLKSELLEIPIFFSSNMDDRRVPILFFLVCLVYYRLIAAVHGVFDNLLVFGLIERYLFNSSFKLCLWICNGNNILDAQW